MSYSNFVLKIIRFQKWYDLENRVRGLSRSLEMSSFDTAHMTRYWQSIVYLLSFLRYSMSKNIALLKSRSGSIKVTENGTIRYTGYSFLLVFYSNFVSKMHRFWDIRLQTTGLGVSQGQWKCHHSIERIWLLINVPRINHGPIVPFPR